MRRAPERRVVLADVARIAGTSEATASRALKDDPRIGAKTRAAVHQAAHKLGYVPNAAARSLRAQRTHILGLLVRDLADPVHGKVAAGFEEAAAGQGYAVFIMTGLHDREREQRALTAFVEHRADGIVVASCVSEPGEVFARVPAQRVVFVQPDYPGLARGEDPPARGVLRTDDAAGFVATVEHLVGRGYRRIAYVGPGNEAADTIRRAATAAALERLSHGPIRFIDAGTDGWRDATMVAREVAADPPDALICYDDKLALAVLDALRATGLVVPDDMAVTGFDGIPAAHQSWPRLTTVEVPSVEVGRRAVEMLMASTRDGRMPASEIMPVRLVVGQSTPRTSQTAGRPLSAVASASRGPRS
ncbi:MAG: LacI family transcriptional regulator [Chloroflexota bacterium]|nr:LacI family transcriptional regulator [Chloroflexota bacterium]